MVGSTWRFISCHVMVGSTWRFISCHVMVGCNHRFISCHGVVRLVLSNSYILFQRLYVTVYDGYMVRFMISIWYGICSVYDTVYDGHMVRFMMSIRYGI